MLNGISTIYCNDWPGLHSKPRDCSFDWYPSVLLNHWIVGFNGSNYICDNTTRTPRGCMAYAGGERPPSNFQDPDIWCTEVMFRPLVQLDWREPSKGSIDEVRVLDHGSKLVGGCRGDGEPRL